MPTTRALQDVMTLQYWDDESPNTQHTACIYKLQRLTDRVGYSIMPRHPLDCEGLGATSASLVMFGVYERGTGQALLGVEGITYPIEYNARSLVTLAPDKCHSHKYSCVVK